MSEHYCEACQKWNAGSCCTICLRIDPAQARWMSESEIRSERAKALKS